MTCHHFPIFHTSMMTFCRTIFTPPIFHIRKFCLEYGLTKFAFLQKWHTKYYTAFGQQTVLWSFPETEEITGCAGEDLNLHALADTGTSSQPGYRYSTRALLLILLCFCFRNHFFNFFRHSNISHLTADFFGRFFSDVVELGAANL